jgi:sugar (pentulose or hexulose) kinase
MRKDAVQVGLIRDTHIIAETCAEICEQAGFANGLLICNGCGDIGANIAGLLVVDEDEEAWALCAECLSRVPLLGSVV